MLPAPARLTRREDFAKAVRRGRRAARRAVVVHLARTDDERATPKVGFVVGRTVGGAVVRHRVQRRLRHLMRVRLEVLPRGALLVVRALPAAAGATSATLGDDLDAALGRLQNTAPTESAASGSRAPGASSRSSAGRRR